MIRVSSKRIIMYHYRKTRQIYRKHRKNDVAIATCVFCSPDTNERIITQNETMFVIPNRVSYDMFEGRRVIDHLMVIPKQHRSTIADFTDQERLDAMALIGQYESDGYNMYGRGVGSKSRSVEHQHTHLIKLSDTMSKLIIYSQKPYVLIDL